MKTIATLVMIKAGDKVLLGRKKRDFGVGWWNGFGGKLQDGEDIIAAAKREVFEECGLTVGDSEYFAVNTFEFLETGDVMEVHMFRTENFSGEPQESEEMIPKWFDIKDIPFQEMWPDDIQWFPLYLSGKKFIGHFSFAAQNKIVSFDLTEVDDLV